MFVDLADERSDYFEPQCDGSERPYLSSQRIKGTRVYASRFGLPQRERVRVNESIYCQSGCRGRRGRSAWVTTRFGDAPAPQMALAPEFLPRSALTESKG